MALGLNLVGAGLGQALTARGLALYLAVIVPGEPSLPIALLAVIIATGLAMLNIKANAKVTGAFLGLELMALAAMALLGFFHPHQPLAQIVLHPTVLAGNALKPASWRVIGLGTASAIFAYNGYGNAVSLGEELHQARSRIAAVVIISLLVAVVVEFTPVIAVLIGMKDPARVFAAAAPMPAFIAEASGPTFAKAISLGVAMAIFNALIAGALINARQLYATGRDQVWPALVSRAIERTHARFRSPWVATAIAGGISAAACFLKLETLIVLTANGVVVLYFGVCLAAIIGRLRGSTARGAYRMPLFPLTPVLAIIALCGVVWVDLQDLAVGLPSLVASLGVMLLFAAYYRFWLRSRSRWALRGPDGDLAAHPRARAAEQGNPIGPSL